MKISRQGLALSNARRARARLVGRIRTAIELLAVSRRALDAEGEFTAEDIRAIQVDLENAERTIAVIAQDIADGDAIG